MAGRDDSRRAAEDEDSLAPEFAEYRRTGDVATRNRLVESHLWLARQEASRFAGRGEPLDDLVQVAQLGLVKAVERYDPGLGVPFTAYARPTIAGELRRHFRDATWTVRVPRGLKELHARLGRSAGELTQRLGRRPTAAEIAADLGCSVDEVLEAMDLGGAYRPASLAAASDEDATLEPAADDEATGLSGAPDRVVVRELLAELPQRERTIVYLRFFAQLTQAEIAERVGMSQVHVSRLLRSTLAVLQARLDDHADPSAIADEPER